MAIFSHLIGNLPLSAAMSRDGMVFSSRISILRCDFSAQPPSSGVSTLAVDGARTFLNPGTFDRAAAMIGAVNPSRSRSNQVSHGLHPGQRRIGRIHGMVASRLDQLRLRAFTTELN